MASIPSKGFCIYLKRIRQEKRASQSLARTIGNYTCYLDGKALTGLSGQLVESPGPGSNKKKKVRIQAGSYPLAVQNGSHYETFGWEKDHLLPALLLENTGEREGILIHPCHDHDAHYISSIGCLNPASGLVNAESGINLQDSLERTLALITALQKAFGKLPKDGTIPHATIIIEGEPA
ncbi:MAG: hypothetical protein ACAI37_04555 [Chthoniobacter sp.]